MTVVLPAGTSSSSSELTHAMNEHDSTIAASTAKTLANFFIKSPLFIGIKILALLYPRKFFKGLYFIKSWLSKKFY